ncbi:hypothetical protein [Levilactobacillus brevis]|uniref:hypothetical protein n=1 Tax=Levilactobacillus brevis TaxID=1580 RepID=UPI0008481052|nr:hypothetical protein [Levilactobacillus brevis]ODP94827.1 hypothetical protein BGC39_10820 [Levilactobacillus brevis]
MKIKGTALLLTTLLLGTALTGCVAGNNDDSMRGRIVKKEILNKKKSAKHTVADSKANIVPLFAAAHGVAGHATAHATPHVSTTHTTTTHAATHVTETTGATHSTAHESPAVRTVKPTTKSGFSTMHQSATSRVYYPFWYTAAIANQDHHHETRYILVVTIKGNKKRLSVSKVMYNRAKVGQTISIDGSKFKIIKKS